MEEGLESTAPAHGGGACNPPACAPTGDRALANPLTRTGRPASGASPKGEEAGQEASRQESESPPCAPQARVQQVHEGNVGAAQHAVQRLGRGRADLACAGGGSGRGATARVSRRRARSRNGCTPLVARCTASSAHIPAPQRPQAGPRPRRRTAAVGLDAGRARRVEEDLAARRGLHQVARRQAHDLHDAQQLLVLVLAWAGGGMEARWEAGARQGEQIKRCTRMHPNARAQRAMAGRAHGRRACSPPTSPRSRTGEQGVAGQQLGQDAAEGPHVDLAAIGQAQDDLGAAVEPGGEGGGGGRRGDACLRW
jgi:hypothetical protein